jgi:hypothetical protein
MNISTVAENLRNTIAGKEKFLEELKLKANRLSWDQYRGGALGYAVAESTVKYLELNLEELKKILADVEKCVA